MHAVSDLAEVQPEGLGFHWRDRLTGTDTAKLDAVLVRCWAVETREPEMKKGFKKIGKFCRQL